ncbi:hypothetical protein SAY86_010298 [Trapa natans]|uniref:Uncharacterized protein n=1 Tax=Trapa natans TaxID=22666 RepID=A0AAN7KSD1_TRANT|nr:hypothetical protein SAY86_010298 [Trapa natans]
MKLLLTGGMKGGSEIYLIRRKDDNRFVRQVTKNLGVYSYVDVPALSITRGRRLPGQDRLSPLLEFLSGLPQRLSIRGKDGFQKKDPSGSFSTSADLLEEQLPGLIHSGEAEAGVHHEMIKLQEVAQALLQMLQHLQGGASIVTPCARISKPLFLDLCPSRKKFIFAAHRRGFSRSSTSESTVD